MAGDLLPAGAAMALTAAGKQTGQRTQNSVQGPAVEQTWLYKASYALRHASHCLLTQRLPEQ
jgi:hypothetical protein